MSVRVDCAECGIVFCLPDDVHARRREDHKTFYCPSGHSNYYPRGSSPKEKRIAALERQVQQLERRLASRGCRVAELEHEVRSLRSRLGWAKGWAA